MGSAAQFPFQSFTFWLIEGRQPRSYMRLSAPALTPAMSGANGLEDATSPENAAGTEDATSPENAADAFYTLELVRGSATNPLSTITRKLPVAQAVNLRDALQRFGVFDWEQSYGDAAALGVRRWALSLVFEAGVFAIESKGGSDVPPHFDEMLEELYRLDFPRPAAPQGGLGAGVGAGASAGAGIGAGAADLQRLCADAQRNPQEFQVQIKEMFKTLSPADQNQLLDLLAATGMASRAWWERFLRD